MKRTLLRSVLVAGVLASGMVAIGGSADAAVIGTARTSVTSGTGASLFNVISSAPCPAGTAAVGVLLNHTSTSGGGDWVDVDFVPRDSSAVGAINSAGAPIAENLLGLASTYSAALDAGVYNFTLECRGELGEPSLGEYTGSFTGTGSGATFAWTLDVAPVPSSATTLTATPTTANLGDSVVLTASVSSTAAVAGTVQFKSNGVNLGAPVAVTAGTATLPTTALGAGANAVTAEFIPTNATIVTGSTSAAVTVTITAPAQATTTALPTFSPAAPTTADIVVVTANVSAASGTPTGTVTFSEGATVLGTAPVTSGAATLSLTPGTLAAGAHDITAAFTPTSAAAFLPSTSAAATVTIGTFAGYALNGVIGSGENITVTIGAGTLTLTAATTPVNLGTATLSADNTALETAPADINPVTVTDSRAGQLGYTVSGIAADFTSASGAKINSENLGWTPKTVGTVPAGISITPGPVVAPANAIAPAAVSSPVLGLKASRVLASAAAGASVGTVQVGATLALRAPTSTVAGTYSTLLVITAI